MKEGNDTNSTDASSRERSFGIGAAAGIGGNTLFFFNCLLWKKFTRTSLLCTYYISLHF